MRRGGKQVPWLGVIAAAAIAVLIACAAILVWSAMESSPLSPADMRGGWMRDEALLRIVYVAPIWMVVAGIGLWIFFSVATRSPRSDAPSPEEAPSPPPGRRVPSGPEGERRRSAVPLTRASGPDRRGPP